jgi:hypothetical protein
MPLRVRAARGAASGAAPAEPRQVTVRQGHRVRIISKGTGQATRVYLVAEDGAMVDITRDVKSVTWSVEGRGAAVATLTFKSTDVDAVGDVEGPVQPSSEP